MNNKIRMKLIKIALAALSIAGFANSASAIVYDYDAHNFNITYLNEGDTYYGSFRNLLPGVDFTQFEIVSAVVTFAFSDTKWKNGYWYTDSGDEWALAKVEGNAVDLGGSKNANGASEVGGSHLNAPTSYDYKSANLGDDEFDDIESGTLEFSVEANQVGNEDSDFYLKGAHLKVTTRAKTPVSVPDTGSTAALLGLAIGGLLAVRRRLTR